MVLMRMVVVVVMVMLIVGCGDGGADDGHDDDLLVKDNVACSGAESCNREQESGKYSNSVYHR